jgi:hypothetical protein
LKDEWDGMMTEVQALCQGQKIGHLLKQSVDLLCSTKDDPSANIAECEREEGTPSNATNSLAALRSTGSGGSSILASTPAISTIPGPTNPTAALSSVLVALTTSSFISPSTAQQTSPLIQSASAVPLHNVPIIVKADAPVTSTPPGLGVLPPHSQYTPPSHWIGISKLTYQSQALNADYSTKYYATNNTWEGVQGEVTKGPG